jgi:hypothetical protein
VDVIDRDPRQDDLFEALSESGAGPDLTGPIMGRLGYMRAAAGAVRRRRRRRLAGRVALVAAGFVAVGIGLQAHRMGPEARGVGAPTLQEAIGHDLDRQQQRLNRTIEWIRELAPPAPVETGPDAPFEGPIDEDVDRSAVAPVRWL